MRALIVDDSRSMRMILGRVLRELGVETLEAGNGLEALEALTAQTKPDVVLVDWHMPEMNGLEFVRAARAQPRLLMLPIMMVTSEAEEALIQQALDAGASEYLMKPFTAESVRMKLEMIGFDFGGAP